ncbi:MAG: TIGR02710 family CRISPR-associated protein [Methanobrevibacter sp.]|jgi:CRISPR-associated protein (TIGR02710 family)|nr:TIGR02710 family CRISPR-associated protein [Methanobrevibacter sp.]
MNDNTLFMTVGTGIGNSQEAVDSLAHGLLYSIKETDPQYIVFFCSESSKRTVDSLKSQYFDEFNHELDFYELVEIINIDDFNECFDCFKKKLIEFKEDYIKIDYTSGTKTMTMTAAICATIYRKDLYLISGKRGKDNLVIKGTESKRTQNLYQIYDKFTLDKIKDAFNQNRFETAIDLLEETKAIENKEEYLSLLQLFNNWDKFNHKKAHEIFENGFDSKFNLFPDFKNDLYQNKNVIKLIVAPRDEKVGCYYKLADLLNNSKRRADEGKYDDGIARLYRALELIAQIKLKIDYNLKTSNIDMKTVEKYTQDSSYIKKLEEKRKDDKVKIGLNDAFEMLKSFDNGLGKKFFERKELIDQRSKRNMSILAHGLEHRTKEEYDEFYDSVNILANELTNKIEKYMEYAKFPKFNT